MGAPALTAIGFFLIVSHGSLKPGTAIALFEFQMPEARWRSETTQKNEADSEKPYE